MHSRLHGVVLLDVQLGQLVVLEHTRLFNVTSRGLVHNGTHYHAFDGLVLRDRLPCARTSAMWTEKGARRVSNPKASS